VGSSYGETHHTRKRKEMIVIDTPEGIDHYRMCQVIAALKLEASTGMKHSRGSILKLAQQQYGCVKRTKKGALAEMLALYEETYGKEYGAKVL
ncbi:MAG: hypothetical protein K0U53_01390, partial [Betaproteobacteria bacterium]|nr:hypothetical protein [Betaproteobacteria bacterium]